jgi:hypothetical protein
MTPAASRSPRATKQRPRNSRSGHRPAAHKAVSGVLGAMLFGAAAFAALVATAGWLLAVSVEARSATRSTVAWDLPLDRLPWQGPLAASMASEPPAMAPALAQVPAIMPAIVRFDVVPSLNPVGALAMVLPDMEPTSSLGPVAVSAKLVAPLPRARPKLASLGPAPGIGISLPDERGFRRTAIYDITARTVYMPNGERMEAHSGLGDMMDDPRHVRRRMRGATPPNVYNLKLREALFHGVQAIRMTPVYEERMFGRDGILAHSYMLGPNGQSNGCVSFKDYPKFLRAFQRGEVDRIVVVDRLPAPPVFPGRMIARNAGSRVEW